MLLGVLHSPVARVVTFPVVVGVLFVINPWVLYFTPLYQATLENPLLHDLLHVHFLVIGCLFFWLLLGIDPVPGRIGYPLRLLVVFATLPFHAFLGITIMGSREILGGEWYGSLGCTWPPTIPSDQELAGILWTSGELVGLLFFAILFAQWVRASRREADREDRRLDRLERLAAAADAGAARDASTVPTTVPSPVSTAPITVPTVPSPGSTAPITVPTEPAGEQPDPVWHAIGTIGASNPVPSSPTVPSHYDPSERA